MSGLTLKQLKKKLVQSRDKEVRKRKKYHGSHLRYLHVAQHELRPPWTKWVVAEGLLNVALVGAMMYGRKKAA